MTTRRSFFALAAAATLGLAGFAGTASASADILLYADIVRGVTDIVVRDYIRDNYKSYGRWDGNRWCVDDRRYTADEYRVYLVDRYERQHKQQKQKQQKPQKHQVYQQSNRQPVHHNAHEPVRQPEKQPRPQAQSHNNPGHGGMPPGQAKKHW